MAKEIKFHREISTCPVCNRTMEREVMGKPIKFRLCARHEIPGKLCVIVIDKSKSGILKGVKTKFKVHEDNLELSITPETAYRTGRFFYIKERAVKGLPLLHSNYCYIDKDNADMFYEKAKQNNLL